MKAREWAVALINREFRGVGDTIEAATHRAGRKYGVPAKTLTRIRHRAYDMKDMKVSDWFSICNAYQRAYRAADAIYKAERAMHEGNSQVLRLADFVAGKESEAMKE